MLLAVPNFSEGRDEATIAAIAAALRSPGVRLLDVHADPDHHRSVFTIAGEAEGIVQALLAGARVALERIDVVARAGSDGATRGQHPHVGALDVAPVVHPREGARGAACAAALVLADRLAEELGLPVLLYGELTAGDPAEGDGAPPPRTRAELRRGGVLALGGRIERGELRPDFGPRRIHPRAGATLVAARPPLIAFNLQLAAPATLQDAREIAARVREGGNEGLPGLRAIAVELRGGVAQVSMNVEEPAELPLARIVGAVRALAPVASAELVGLAPAAAFEGFPDDLPVPGFDPARHLIENALGC